MHTFTMASFIREAVKSKECKVKIVKGGKFRSFKIRVSYFLDFKITPAVLLKRETLK